MSKPGVAGTSSVNISVRRWTTEEERQSLLEILRSGGSSAVAQALPSREDLGFIVFDDGRMTLRYAYATIEGDERRVVLVTERPIGAAEVRGRLRTLDYPLSIIKFRVNEGGKGGEGTITLMAEIIFDEETGTLATKSYSAQPLRLVSIKSRN